ncbi:von Willebrand factor A domain-containing protein 5A [Balamuthia mandrillaris]
MENEEALTAYQLEDALHNSAIYNAPPGEEARPNVFTACIGSIPSGHKATIKLTYITELAFEKRERKGARQPAVPHNVAPNSGRRIKFSLPSRLAPKPKKPSSSSSSSSFYDKGRTPSLKLFVDVQLEMSERIQGVAANQPISLGLKSEKTGRVTVGGGSLVKGFKHDFGLYISLTKQQSNRCYALLEAPQEEGGAYTAVLVVYPKALMRTAGPSSAEKDNKRKEDKEGGEEEDKKKTTAEKEENKGEGEDEDEEEEGGEEGEEDGEGEEGEGEEGEEHGEAEKWRDEKQSGGGADQSATNTRQPKPALTDLHLEWTTNDGSPLSASIKEKIKHSFIPTSVILNRPVLLVHCSLPFEAFGQSSKNDEDKMLKVTIAGDSTRGGGKVSLDLELKASDALRSEKYDALLHQLFARSLVRGLERSLEDGKAEWELKKEIIELGMRYGLSSRFTTFVGVERQQPPAAEEETTTPATVVEKIVPLNGPAFTEARRYHDSRARAGRSGGGRGGRGGYGGGRGSGRDSRRFDDRGASTPGNEQQYNRDTDSYRGRGGGGRGGSGRGGRGGGRDFGRRGGGYSSSSWDQGRRGTRGEEAASPPPPKELKVSAATVEALIALKPQQDVPYWKLASPLAAAFGLSITDLTDGLIGLPLSDFVSNIWATALVLAATRTLSEEEKAKWAQVTEPAEQWLSAEAEKNVLHDLNHWLTKANAFLTKRLRQ